MVFFALVIFFSKLFTMIFSFLVIFVALCAAGTAADDQWAPDLRVAIFPLESHSSADNNYGTYSVKNNSKPSPVGSHHYHYNDHHYHHHHYHAKHRLSHDADNYAIICLMEQNRAQWTLFGNWSQCSDNCGGCGTRWRSRECQRGHSRCECHGVEKEEEACNLEVCIYPRKACCAGRQPTTIGGKFACERIEKAE